MFDTYLHFLGRKAEHSQLSSVIAVRAKLSSTKASITTSLWKPQIHCTLFVYFFHWWKTKKRYASSLSPFHFGQDHRKTNTFYLLQKQPFLPWQLFLWNLPSLSTQQGIHSPQHASPTFFSGDSSNAVWDFILASTVSLSIWTRTTPRVTHSRAYPAGGHNEKLKIVLNTSYSVLFWQK